MKLKLHYLFVAEAKGAVSYYDGLRPGLGNDLIEELKVKLALLRILPGMGPEWKTKRRIGLDTIPAGIIYRVFNNHVYIMGLKPDAMEDEPWVKRT